MRWSKLRSSQPETPSEPDPVLPPVQGESPFRLTLQDYSSNLLVGTSLRQLTGDMLRRLLSLDTILEIARSTRGTRRGSSSLLEYESLSELRTDLISYIKACKGQSRKPRTAQAAAESNLARLSQLLELDPNQREVLRFLAALHESSDLREIVGCFGEMSLGRAAGILAAATMCPEGPVFAALSPTSRLTTSGIVEVDRCSRSDMQSKLMLKAGLLDALLEQDLDGERLLTRFLPQASPSNLDWGDFEHLGESVRTARDLLAAAVRTRLRGMNVLFYGDTGTGKTELARLLAADIGAKLYIAGRTDENGGSAEAHERLSSLLLGERLLGDGTSLLLFDEMEDIFTWTSFIHEKGRATNSMSKQWFNHLLESNPVPVVWVTNKADGIDPAFLRRFSFALEFRRLGPRQRSRVLARHLGKNSTLSEEDVTTIARRYEVSPAQLGTAVASARLLSATGQPDRSTIERVLTPMAKIVTGQDPASRPVFHPTVYRIDALSSASDLSAIADQLANWKSGDGPGLSLCLYGPPGTGKSEYVKYLAHRMGCPILCRHVSDILSPWVGMSERLIAESFRHAEEDGSLLLFDEVDSFLRDRRLALHSWEVTGVNEFLQRLEAHRGVVACTTNLWHDVDEASLRRFVFKIEFRFLTIEQSMILFRTKFDHILESPLTVTDESKARSAFERLTNLTPGDFAAVERRLRALGGRVPAHRLVEEIVSEARAKRGTGGAIGF